MYGAPPPAPPVDDPGGALARRYLQVHGPSTPQLFRYWAMLTLPHAKRLWERAGELAPVGDKWVLAEDAELDAPAPKGARLLPNLDPLASAKDREVLVPDAAVRKRIWSLARRPRAWCWSTARSPACGARAKKGKRLVVNVEPLRRAALRGRRATRSPPRRRASPPSAARSARSSPG